MNDLQKTFKDMVTMFISSVPNLTESIIDSKIKEVRYIPSFMNLSDDEVNEVCAAIKSEFSIKLDIGTLIE